MKLMKMFVGIAILALTSISTAHAGEKVMASAPLPAGTQTLYCDMTNIDPVAAKDVTGELLDINGNVVWGPATQNILPGTGTFYGGVSGSAAWCRFTVNGSTKYLRGVAIYDNGVDYSASLPVY